MEYTFFYLSLAVVWVAFAVCIRYKPLELRHIIIGITSVGYSLVYDSLFGNQLGLYYYISPKWSTLFMVLSALFLYSVINMLYALFIPKNGKTLITYTTLWILGMLVFEYASVVTGTIVFTGWEPVPWSFITYIATYTWIYLFYRYLSYKCLGMSKPKKV
ncbi:MAG: hypothetical protein N2645_22390 [Clostridia bacterium]|nr:hypothetical protein [Clostridia bacterium]